MNLEGSSIQISLGLFDGKHSYLDACDLWEAIEDVHEVPPLLDNPTVVKIKKSHREEMEKDQRKNNLVWSISIHYVDHHNNEFENTQQDLIVFEARLQWK